MICFRLNGVATESGQLTNKVYAPVKHKSLNSSKKTANRTYEDKQAQINGGGS